MKGCKYCRTPHQDILTFVVGEDKDGFEITGHVKCGELAHPTEKGGEG